jgi:DNA-binding MarR family transcriptional regulator
LVHAPEAGPAALARRLEVSAGLARLLEQGRSSAAGESSPLAAEATVGGAVAVIEARLLVRPRAPLTELQAPLMSFVVLPYLGTRAARCELDRPLPPRSAAGPPDALADPLADVSIRVTHRSMRALRAIAASPGLKNTEVSEASGITDEGQASKLLARLARAGLIENVGEGAGWNATKSWRLTPAGERLERSIRPELPS